VEPIEREVKTTEPNGTTIDIEDIHLRSIDQAQVIKYVERHIARWPNATVYFNTHLCEYTEPPVAYEYVFVPDDEPFRSMLGGAKLTIKASKVHLDESQQGVAIIRTSCGT
jgi:hypothetical protein